MSDVQVMAEWPRIIKGKRYEVRASGQVRVTEGFGRVDEATLKAGNRNGQVKIAPEHLTRPIQGWCEATSPIWGIVEAAQITGARVAYRVVLERRRPRSGQPPIDTDIPIEDLNRQEQTTSMVEFIYVVDGAGAPVSPPPPGWGWALPESAEPIEAAPPAPAPEPPRAEAPAQTVRLLGGDYFPPTDVPTCPLCGGAIAGSPVRRHTPTGRFAHRSHFDAAGAVVDQAVPPAPSAAPVVPDAARPGPRVAEAKPWERTNSDGTPNLGSFAIQASLSMVELASSLTFEHILEGGGGVPNMEHVKALAARLLQAADRCQQLVRADHHFDRADNSHTRARGAVRAALAIYPVPWDEDPAARQAARDQWVCNLADYAAGMLRAAIELDR